MPDFPKQLETLVARFDQNIEAYQSQVYNETQVRREFIDPFFEALGWDIANKAGYAEAYKDVIHEGAGLLFPHRWRPEILRRGEETGCQYQRGL